MGLNYEELRSRPGLVDTLLSYHVIPRKLTGEALAWCVWRAQAWPGLCIDAQPAVKLSCEIHKASRVAPCFTFAGFAAVGQA
jgi:hypothetical protein